MTLVIGFGNKARHGKDTAGEAVRDYYERQARLQAKHDLKRAAPVVKIYKWADALYAEVNEFLSTGEGQAWLRGGHDACIEIGIHVPLSVQPTYPKMTAPNSPFGKHSQLLQWWGTEYRRNNYGYDYWVNKVIEQIKKENPDIALITDTRFVNEADAVKKLGGYTVNVTRLNADGTPFVAPDRPADHPSETNLDNYNWDFKLVIGDGHAALTGQLATALVEYLRQIHK